MGCSLIGGCCRASRVLVALCGVDVGVAGEIYKRKPLAGSVSAGTAFRLTAHDCAKCHSCSPFRAIMGCPDSALGVVRAKQPHAMTTEDALTVAIVYGQVGVQLSTCRGFDAPIEVRFCT